MIEDDIDGNGFEESSVTYYGTGDYTWWEVVQCENSVRFPSLSTRFPFVAEGRSFVKLEDEVIDGSAFLVGFDPDTFCLIVDD